MLNCLLYNSPNPYLLSLERFCSSWKLLCTFSEDWLFAIFTGVWWRLYDITQLLEGKQQKKLMTFVCIELIRGRFCLIAHPDKRRRDFTSWHALASKYLIWMLKKNNITLTWFKPYSLIYLFIFFLVFQETGNILEGFSVDKSWIWFVCMKNFVYWEIQQQECACFRKYPVLLLNTVSFNLSKSVWYIMFVPTSDARMEKTFSLYKQIWIVCRNMKYMDFAKHWS